MDETAAPHHPGEMKVDLKREIASYTARRGRFDVVDVPELQYLAVDGVGDPNTAPQYRAAVEAIFPAAYRVKFFSKRELGRDYVVMPLEALWWAADMAVFTTVREKSRWSWTLLNLVPDWITAEHLTAVGHPGVRLERLAEGRCVQTLHVGPYDEEGPVLTALHEEFLPAQGYAMTGHHHEIYLGDARRTAPARLRTILRQPVGRISSGTPAARG